MISVCLECHKIILEKSSAFVLNEHSYFCSRSCCDHYLMHYSNYFEQEEERLRVEMSLENESEFQVLSHIDLCEEVLRYPLETSKYIDHCGQEFFAQYGQVELKGQKQFIVLLFTVVDEENVFLFIAASKDRSFVQHFLFKEERRERKEDSEEELISPLGAIGMNEKELMNLLDSKKSGLLAELMSLDDATDFSFSDYIKYQDDGVKVLNNPDEIYMWKDDVGDSFCTHSKVIQRDGEVYYYLVISMVIEEGLFPVFMFPTKKQNVLELFQRGEKKLGLTRN